MESNERERMLAIGSRWPSGILQTRVRTACFFYIFHLSFPVRFGFFLEFGVVGVGQGRKDDFFFFSFSILG